MSNTDLFDTNNYEFNKIAGGYKYRWGDIEIIGLFAYMHLDNPLVDFNLKKVYACKLPNATLITN